MAWNVRIWGHLDDVPLDDGDGDGCRLLHSVPGPLQSVQRAEIWGGYLALQACTPVFVGVDNKNVVNHVGHLLDGDLLQLVADILHVRAGARSKYAK